jgi:D-glycero-alpha-D-manno-heptose-7-phosphate kinase
MLIFTGLSRVGAEVSSVLIDNLSKAGAALHRMRAMVDEALGVLSSDADLEAFGRLLDESWELKRTLASGVTNATVDGLYETARRAGAIGGKLLGAGGGGFLLLFVRPEDRGRVRAALGPVIEVPVRFETSGSQIVLYQPDGL